ncbi:MAG: co-chaperone GroES [bacterium]|nr:co-chaperone GroES [bacterium]
MSKDLKITPSYDYVLIEPVEAEKTTPSGIVLPDSVDKKPQLGKVLAVGQPSQKDKKSPCKVGDVIVYRKWGGEEFEHQSKKLLFVKFEDVLGIIGN